MEDSRSTSASRACFSTGQWWVFLVMSQPKAPASSAQKPYSAAWIMIFLGTQPTLTQVPPQNRCSATPTRAPCVAAMRAQRTPPEPPPITNRSKS